MEKPIRLLIVAPSLNILGGQAVQAKHLYEHLSNEPQFEVSFVAHNPRLPGPFRLLQKDQVRAHDRHVLALLQKPAARSSQHRRHPHVFGFVFFVFAGAYSGDLHCPILQKESDLNYRSGEAEDHLRSWPRTAVPIIRLADQLISPCALPRRSVSQVWFARARDCQHDRSRSLQVSRAPTFATGLFV